MPARLAFRLAGRVRGRHVTRAAATRRLVATLSYAPGDGPDAPGDGPDPLAGVRHAESAGRSRGPCGGVETGPVGTRGVAAVAGARGAPGLPSPAVSRRRRGQWVPGSPSGHPETGEWILEAAGGSLGKNGVLWAEKERGRGRGTKAEQVPPGARPRDPLLNILPLLNEALHIPF